MTKPDINDSIQRFDEHHIERHEYFLNFKQQNKIGLLFIGDSITRRWLEQPQNLLWDSYFSKYNPANFGVGMDMIQNLKWRLLNGELEDIQPKIVVLLIGTNNLPNYNIDEVYQGVEGLVDVIQQKLPHSKIILMGLLPRDPDDACNDYISIVTEINAELFKMAKTRNLIFLDIGKEYIIENNRVDRSLMDDGLHLIEPGYKIWGDRISPIIKEYF
ncbi:MAG TPA: GDSL-type esterase/lipase family protein [Pseudobacteroides sp.]|uniref:GDSL-type esterase/lipase family protein n=1 Tax=Pseudobacteroides sp. TaxID=1968840 RepID=UPI002F93C355